MSKVKTVNIREFKTRTDLQTSGFRPLGYKTQTHKS